MTEIDPNHVVERGEVVEGLDSGSEEREEREEFIEQPAKVMRVGTMLKQLLDEVRSATLDEASRDRLRDIYETSVQELGSALSPDLRRVGLIGHGPARPGQTKAGRLGSKTMKGRR